MAISGVLQQASTRKGLHKYLLAAFAGVLFPLSFSPYHLWYLTPVSICLLLLALSDNGRPSGHSAFKTGWFYGLGMFGNGTSWIYISIHDYGFTGMPLAILMTMFFVMGLSLLPALQLTLFKRGFCNISPVWSFPALWVLFEWVRSWILTGFPWLFAGNALVDSPLSPWLPVGGVYLASFILIMSGVLIYRFVVQKLRLRTLLAYLIIVFAGSHLLNGMQWVTPTAEKPLKVAMVQGNIDQNKKWLPQHRDEFLLLYRDLTQDIQNADIVIWPETSVPMLIQQSRAYTNRILADLPAGTAFIAGMPERATPAGIRPAQYYNAIMARGDAQGIYRKQKLVPFGEYVPLESMLRGAIAFFNLPMSSFTAGEAFQPELTAKGFTVAPFICYEVVYPEFVRQRATDSDLLITISNDSWFGRSAGPLQHLQMARVRAAENGRYMLRSTNNGVTAVIDYKGRITDTSPQFEQAIVRGEVWPMQGQTPYNQLGSAPLLIFLAALLLIQFVISRRSRPRNIFSV